MTPACNPKQICLNNSEFKYGIIIIVINTIVIIIIIISIIIQSLVHSFHSFQ